jgi:hypothetical protein
MSRSFPNQAIWNAASPQWRLLSMRVALACRCAQGSMEMEYCSPPCPPAKTLGSSGGTRTGYRCSPSSTSRQESRPSNELTEAKSILYQIRLGSISIFSFPQCVVCRNVFTRVAAVYMELDYQHCRAGSISACHRLSGHQNHCTSGTVSVFCSIRLPVSTLASRPPQGACFYPTRTPPVADTSSSADNMASTRQACEYSPNIRRDELN